LEGDVSGVDGRGVCSGVEVGGEVREGSEEGTLGVLWGLVDIVGERLGRSVAVVFVAWAVW